MVAFGITNQNAVPVLIEAESSDDDGVFLSLRIMEQDSPREVADVLIDTVADAEELLNMVTEAVAEFKRLKT